MLDARGTRRFYELSRQIFGDPRDRFPDVSADNLAIARLWASRPRARDEEQSLSALKAARLVHAICDPLLGGQVKVAVHSRLTANAAAGATRITLKKGARFSPRQVRALAHHEGLWHVLTSLNGFRQPVLTVLGVGLARHTESQEGGGIVAEYLTGNITDERYIELGERTIAIDMAARGADFLEVYRYLLARFTPPRAAQMAERVFRGGVVEGGRPLHQGRRLPARLLPDLQLPAGRARAARPRPGAGLPLRQDERGPRRGGARAHRGGARGRAGLPARVVHRRGPAERHRHPLGDHEPLQPPQGEPLLRAAARRRGCAERPGGRSRRSSVDSPVDEEFPVRDPTGSDEGDGNE